jgi:hypothetical protein
LKLTPECVVEHLDGSSNEAPAALADLLVGAARADLVVVGHVNVEHELAALRLQRAGRKRLAVARLVSADRNVGQLTRWLYCGPISKREGVRRSTSFWKSRAVLNEL